MTTGTKIDEKLEGADNFRVWTYKVSILLEEHDLENYNLEKVIIILLYKLAQKKLLFYCYPYCKSKNDLS